MESQEWILSKMKEGVNLILEEWPAVRMALEHGYVSENFEKLQENGEMVGDTQEDQILNYLTQEISMSVVSIPLRLIKTMKPLNTN